MTKNKFIKTTAIVVAIALLIGGTFAFFTDYVSEQVNGTAGTVKIALNSNIDLLDANGQDILNPGDLRDGSFEVENLGNKSIDVKTVINLTSSLPMTQDGQAEYELYARENVTYVEGVGNIPVIFGDDFGYDGKTGDEAIIAFAKDFVKDTVKMDAVTGTVNKMEPLSMRTMNEDSTKITYSLEDIVLNGVDTGSGEFETVEGVTEDKHLYDFVLIVKPQMANEFQDSTVTIDVEVLAKQHENTGAGWHLVSSEVESTDPVVPDGNTYSIRTAASKSFLSLAATDGDGSEVTQAESGSELNVGYYINENIDTLTGDDDAMFVNGELEVTSYNIYNADTYELIDTVEIVDPDAVAASENGGVMALDIKGDTTFTMPNANVVIVENTEVNMTVREALAAARIYDFVFDASHVVMSDSPNTYARIATKDNFTSYDGATISQVNNVTTTTGRRGSISADSEIEVSYVFTDLNSSAAKKMTNNGLFLMIIDAETSELIESHSCTMGNTIKFKMPEKDIRIMPVWGDHVSGDYVAMDIGGMTIKMSDLTNFGSVTLTSDKEMKGYGYSYTFDVGEDLPDYIWVQPGSNMRFTYTKELHSLAEYLEYNNLGSLRSADVLSFLKKHYEARYKNIANGLPELEGISMSSRPGMGGTTGSTETQLAKLKANFSDPQYLSDLIGQGMDRYGNFEYEYTLDVMFDLDRYTNVEGQFSHFSKDTRFEALDGYVYEDLFSVTNIQEKEGNLVVDFKAPAVAFTLYQSSYDANVKGFEYENCVNEMDRANFEKFVDEFTYEALVIDGPTYMVGVTSRDVGAYDGYTAIYTDPAEFPETPSYGDVYVDGEYEYRYNAYYWNFWRQDAGLNGWGVRVLDENKSEYGAIAETVANAPIVNMCNTFQWCRNLTTAPEIPSTVNTIENCFNRSAITKAPVLPEGLVNMNYAFSSTAIETAPVIPSTVTSMNGTFSYCDKLTAAPAIPAGVTNLEMTFNYCTALTDASAMVVPAVCTSMNNTFEGCTLLTKAPSIEVNTASMTMERTFKDCTSLVVGPTIPEGVVAIGDYNNSYYDGMDYGVFHNCTSLTTVGKLPSTLERTNGAFNNCTSLVNAPELADGLTVIAYMFTNCSALENAPVIPDTVRSMQGAFLGCTALVDAPEIPASATNLFMTFQGCTSLKNVGTLPNTAALVSTFKDCSALENAPVIPSTVTSMANTFSGCSSLKTVGGVPAGVTNMTMAFQGCSSLVSAPAIPNAVINLASTFNGCTALTGNIVVDANPTSYNDFLQGTVEVITLSGSSTLLNELAATANNGNASVAN